MTLLNSPSLISNALRGLKCEDFWSRFTRNIQIYTRDGVIVIRSINHSLIAAPQTASLISHRAFGPFGVFEWYGTMEPDLLGHEWQGMEREHGDGGVAGGAWFWIESGTNHGCQSQNGAGSDSTMLTGQNWSGKTKFRIDWRKDYVKYYVNGALVATHRDHVPQKSMNWLLEQSIETALNEGVRRTENTFYIKEIPPKIAPC